MKCEYCKGSKFIQEGKETGIKANGYVGLDVWLDYNKLNIDGSVDVYEPNYIEIEIEINYCPMCGRKLIVEDVSEDNRI